MLGLCASTTGGTDCIPSQGTKTLHDMLHVQKTPKNKKQQQKKEEEEKRTNDREDFKSVSVAG